MRLLLTHKPGGAYGIISESWANAAKDMGITVVRWNGDIHSWFSFKPDVYIGCSGHRQPIPVNHGAKIAIHVNPIDKKCGFDDSSEAAEWVVRHKPDVVFGYALPCDAHWWDRWTGRYNIPFVPMATAGDITLYKPDYAIPDSIDLAYVGGYWPYKAKSIDKFLIPAIKQFNSQVYGWGSWPVAAGQIEDSQIPVLLNKAKVGPCISEPHTHSLGFDLPERVFKVILSGAIPVHDPALNINKIVDGIPSAKSPDDFVHLCRVWIEAQETVRKKLSFKLVKSLVENGHTYHHRLANLLRSLGFEYVNIAKEKCDAYLSSIGNPW